MDATLLNSLISGGPFGLLAALFLYLWQKSEGEKRDMRREYNDLRDAYEVKAESHTRALLDLQEKRLGDMSRVEGIVMSNTTAIVANNGLVQSLLVSRG